MYADLHTHSTRSGGTLTPEELIIEAKKAGIRYLAITDHNKLLPNISQLQKEHPDMYLIQGSEISAVHTFESGKQEEIHILGILLEETDELKVFLAANEMGSENYKSVKETVEQIRAAKGIAILAHPFNYRLTREEFCELQTAFIEAKGHAQELYGGGDNIPKNYLFTITELKHNLKNTCGSNFHGREPYNRLEYRYDSEYFLQLFALKYDDISPVKPEYYETVKDYILENTRYIARYANSELAEKEERKMAELIRNTYKPGDSLHRTEYGILAIDFERNGKYKEEAEILGASFVNALYSMSGSADEHAIFCLDAISAILDRDGHKRTSEWLCKVVDKLKEEL